MSSTRVQDRELSLRRGTSCFRPSATWDGRLLHRVSAVTGAGTLSCLKMNFCSRKALKEQWRLQAGRRNLDGGSAPGEARTTAARKSLEEGHEQAPSGRESTWPRVFSEVLSPADHPIRVRPAESEQGTLHPREGVRCRTHQGHCTFVTDGSTGGSCHSRGRCTLVTGRCRRLISAGDTLVPEEGAGEDW